MKPETNLFLRSLIGKEKQRLIAEKTRIVSGNCSQSPASLRLPPEDVDKIIQIDRDAKELNSALSELRKEAEKQAHLGKRVAMMMKDEIHVTASMDDLSEKPKITRPTDEDIEHIRYELDRAGYLALTVNRYSFQHVQGAPLFLVETARLLESISHARTQFNAAFPEEARK